MPSSTATTSVISFRETELVKFRLPLSCLGNTRRCMALADMVLYQGPKDGTHWLMFPYRLPSSV